MSAPSQSNENLIKNYNANEGEPKHCHCLSSNSSLSVDEMTYLKGVNLSFLHKKVLKFSCKHKQGKKKGSRVEVFRFSVNIQKTEKHIFTYYVKLRHTEPKH